jgi:hypothetical protein
MKIIEAKMGSWNRAAVRRELEPRSRGIAIVRSHYLVTTSEDIAGWKSLGVIL